MKLTNSYRIRLSNEDLSLLNDLRRLRIKPTTFIRTALREKIAKELPRLLEKEKQELNKIYCPF